MSESIGQFAQPDNSMNSKPVKKRSIKKIIGYVVVVFVVLVVCLTYSLFSSEAKKAVPSDQTDGKTYKFTVNLTKENDMWKVLNFTSKAQ